MWGIFVFLTIVHPIADFFTPYRGWGKGWKQFFLSEWFLAINPLHFIWDKWSPLRRHHKFTQVKSVFWEQFATGLDENNASLGYRESVIVDWWFWRWLAVDQLYHMLSNLFLAWVIGVVF